MVQNVAAPAEAKADIVGAAYEEAYEKRSVVMIHYPKIKTNQSIICRIFWNKFVASRREPSQAHITGMA